MDPQQQEQLDLAMAMAKAEHKNKPSLFKMMFMSREKQMAMAMNSAMNTAADPAVLKAQQQMAQQLMAQQQMAMQQMVGQPGGVPVQAQAVAPVEQQGPAAKIMELKGLLDAGAITQEEFDQKKANLLGSM